MELARITCDRAATWESGAKRERGEGGGVVLARSRGVLEWPRSEGVWCRKKERAVTPWRVPWGGCRTQGSSGAVPSRSTPLTAEEQRYLGHRDSSAVAAGELLM